MRDYRASVSSNIQSPNFYSKEKSFLYHASAWKYYSRETQNFIKSKPEKILITYYENLVENKEEEIHKIFSFLNIPFSNDVFDFYKPMMKKLGEIKKSKMPDYILKRLEKKIMDLSKPINKNRIHSWKEQLTEYQQTCIDFICQKEGAFFGYQSNTKADLFQKAYLSFLQAGYHFFFTSYFYLLPIKTYYYFLRKRANTHLSRINK